MDERFLRTLNVGLDDEGERLHFAFGGVGKEVRKIHRMSLRKLHVAVLCPDGRERFSRALRSSESTYTSSPACGTPERP